MSSGGDSDRSRDHLRSLHPRCYDVLPTKPYSRARSLSINRISTGTPSPYPSTSPFPHKIRDYSIESNAMSVTPLLTQYYVQPNVSPSHAATPNETLSLNTWIEGKYWMLPSSTKECHS
ncbi:hypothetical protein H5410_026691 [Solanum commersonii]|uniref:Uncharacterized protein n=1 Tax=Solanum commersonii TaxID=4109 RepID=A0A9J5YZS1_SOLCO|nr:hypothetical protein H5410_026691 [Solanum commersonii]